MVQAFRPSYWGARDRMTGQTQEFRAGCATQQEATSKTKPKTPHRSYKQQPQYQIGKRESSRGRWKLCLTLPCPRQRFPSQPLSPSCSTNATHKRSPRPSQCCSPGLRRKLSISPAGRLISCPLPSRPTGRNFHSMSLDQ